MSCSKTLFKPNYLKEATLRPEKNIILTIWWNIGSFPSRDISLDPSMKRYRGYEAFIEIISFFSLPSLPLVRFSPVGIKVVHSLGETRWGFKWRQKAYTESGNYRSFFSFFPSLPFLWWDFRWGLKWSLPWVRLGEDSSGARRRLLSRVLIDLFFCSVSFFSFFLLPFAFPKTVVN